MPLMPSLEWPSPTNKNLPYKNKTKKNKTKKTGKETGFLNQWEEEPFSTTYIPLYKYADMLLHREERPGPTLLKYNYENITSHNKENPLYSCTGKFRACILNFS